MLDAILARGKVETVLDFDRAADRDLLNRWLCGDDRYIFLHITLPAHCERAREILEANGYQSHVRKLRSIISEETFRDPS